MTHERCEKVNAIFKEIHTIQYANTLKFLLDCWYLTWSNPKDRDEVLYKYNAQKLSS